MHVLKNDTQVKLKYHAVHLNYHSATSRSGSDIAQNQQSVVCRSLSFCTWGDIRKSSVGEVLRQNGQLVIPVLESLSGL